MQEENIEKKKYKNKLKINIYFNEKGETLEKIIEKAFASYCKNKV